jgi:Leucine-rich repeat (LRR) protein/3',5'-cyclic AMP phosphodiesterase CpdA
MSLTESGRRVLSDDELAEVLRRARDEQWHELALVSGWRAQRTDVSLGQEWPPERTFFIESLPDKTLSALPALDRLRALALVDLKLGTEGAKALGLLTGLTSLALGSNEIGDEGAKALASLTSLTSLDLGGNGIGDEGAKALGLLTSLTSLDLGGNGIGDEGAKALASLTGLTYLTLSDNGIGDEGAKALASLTRLTFLELFHSDVGDEGAKVFVSLTGLTSLNLSYTGIGDEGAMALASLSSLTSLNLDGNGIGDEGAKSLASLTNLSSLVLGHNRIGGEGAKALGSLTGLVYLDIGGNRIGEEGAKALASLTRLTFLDLFHSGIGAEGARALASLTRLTALDLEGNGIGAEGAKALSSLTRLTTLNLDGNGIGDEGAKALAALTGLTSLKLRDNGIGDEGAKALGLLTSLTSLELGGNRIGDEGAKSLALLACLTFLDLIGNGVGDDGANALASLLGLEALSISNNNVACSRSLVFMPSLVTLDLYGNPITDAPLELLGDSWGHNCLPDLQPYFHDLDQGAVPNRAVKVLLLGNGCVGKTTLAHCLAKDQPPAEPVVDRTHGIERQTFDLALSPEESVEVRLWDLGGQERYHAMHRLFVHPNALYLLLWAEETSEASDEEHHPVSYWLDLLEQLAPGAGVLLVKNQIDRADTYGRPRELEGREFGHVREVKISATQYRDIDTLKKFLVGMLRETRLRWGYLLPVSWHTVQTTLDAWRQTGDEGKPLRQVSRGRFEQLCAQQGVSHAGILLSFLHATGSVFYRAERFGDAIVLDQDWFLNALYRLFDKKSGAYTSACELGGVLSGLVFAKYWADEFESEADVETYFDFLLQTGMAFELTRRHATSFAKRTLVVPALLPIADDERLSHVLDPWNDPVPGESWFRFHYPFLHRGQIERIIVALSSLSVGRSWWRDGLVVKDPESGCLLRLQASREPASSPGAQPAPYLELRLRKGRPLDAFARVRKTLDKLLGRPPTRTLVSNDGATYVDLAKLDKARRADKPHVLNAYDEDDHVAREPYDRFAPFAHPPEQEQDLVPEKPTPQVTRIFISYAEEDRSYRDELVTQLTLLKRQVAIEPWHDGQLLAGAKIADEIGKQLDTADLVLLLVSPNFVSSEKCFSDEMARALKKYDEKRGAVVPIVVRPTTGWKDLVLGRHRTLPSNEQPISRWSDKDDAWADVSEGLLRLLKQRGASGPDGGAPLPKPAEAKPAGQGLAAAGPSHPGAPSAPPQRQSSPHAPKRAGAPEPWGQVLFAWLHLSDIHFGHGDPTHRWNQTLVLQALRNDVANLVRVGRAPRPNAVLVTGDINFSGATRSRTEYNDARSWLTAVANEVDLSAAEVFVVPGNHDVQRSADQADRNVGRLVDAVREGKVGLDDALGHGDDATLLAKRLANYLTFAADFAPARLDPATATTPRFFWRHERPLSGGLQLRLVGLNTALLAANDDDKGRLRLGEAQLAHALLDASSSRPTVVVMMSHHPFHGGWLADEKSADAWVRNHAHLHLSGHVHEANTTQFVSAGGRSFLRIAAGAAHDENGGAPMSHGYNIAALVCSPKGKVQLRVWPRRWSPGSTTFHVDASNVPDGEACSTHEVVGVQPQDN